MDDSDEYVVDDPGEMETNFRDDAGPKTKKLNSGESAAKKAFQHKWLEMRQFSGWLEAVPSNKFAAKCRCCGMFLNCGKSDLIRHAKTSKHERNAKSFAHVTPANVVLGRKSDKQIHEENVKSMEIQLSAFYAEHNVAFLTVDHLVEIVKKGAKDSAIAKDVKLGHKKCTALVKNVIAKTETEELVGDLKNTLFSVMVDESTDTSGKKNMCILVRYVSPTSLLVVTKLLEIVEVDAHDAGADALWKLFTECLDRHGVPLTNIIGLACDNAAVMVGVRASFWTKLKAACPWAILLNCICHTSALISKAACKQIPSFVESHLRKISAYVNGSPKRCAELQDFQELYEEELQKILSFSNTRWLIMHACIRRYLQHHDSLYGFFRTVVREDPGDKEANQILHEFNNPFTLGYIYFLDYALEFFNQFNALYQSKGVLIHKLFESSQKLLKKFCQNFIVFGKLDNLATLKLTHPSNFLPLESVYLGPKCSSYLAKMEIPVPPIDAKGRKKSEQEVQKEKKELKEAFFLKCLAFYTKGAEEMQGRLPLTGIFREMSFLDPKVLLSAEARSQELPDLNTLATKFQEKLNIDLNALAIEWRTAPTEIDGCFREKLLTKTVEEAWAEIATLKNFSGEQVFPQLTKLAHCVMSLPHSNADSERIFSIVTDTKTTKRNRMGVGSLNALAVVRSSFASKGITCGAFKVTAAHLSKFDSNMYKD